MQEATRLEQETGTIFINRGLFSSYYLGTLLAREVRARQGETGTRLPNQVRRRLQGLWDRETSRLGASTGYVRTRQVWLEPLLTALGYEPLEPAHAADFGEEALPHGSLLYQPIASDRPEHAPAHASVPTAAEVRFASSAPLPEQDETESELETSIDDDDDSLPETEENDEPASTSVLLSLLGWGEGFDQPFATARRRSETPHKLMERLLATGPAQWGLILNGQRLRLLKRTVVAGRQQYLEVDLETLFESGSDRDFDTFWILFRAQAFQVGNDGRCLMEVIDEGSRKHAEGVSSTLKASVFNAIETLMSSLVKQAQEVVRLPIPLSDLAAQHRRNLAEQALGNLPKLYEQSLILMYRLLFVLYAESRALLPVDNEIYRDSYSLEPLRDEIERPGNTYLPDSFRLWETIQSLFRLIHRGCNTTRLVVPAYNGELFRPESTALLNALRVPDDALAEVLRQLSMTPPTRDRGRERISYRDLGVEQLGSVYEGLLEFEPRLASEPMIEVKYKDEPVIIPAREQREYRVLRQFEVGAFYLGRGAGRKTSGSYYTPQPLVDFLVQRTLSPLVEGKTAEQILELKVVDPAMGSGAFLVGACLFLTEAYVRALRREQPGEEERSSAESEQDYDDSNSGDDEEALSEEATRPYRRVVAERCLYGVDLNLMAVELAKVSLWLTTLAGDKPLTFLDAHLRCGNSLIGAPLRSYQSASGRMVYSIDTIHPEANKRLQKGRAGGTRRQGAREENSQRPSLFSKEELQQAFQPLVDRRQWLAEAPSDTVVQVHEKAALFQQQVEQDPTRRALKAVCDLWVATWFWQQPPEGAKPGDANWSLPMDGQIYRQLVQTLRGKSEFILSSLDLYLREAQRIADEQRPFHWELEFPEVYYEADGHPHANPGFDAVLGNPPWDTIMPNSREFFAAYDPGFRELERMAAKRRQDELLAELPDIRTAWDNYVANLDSQDDYFRVSEAYPYENLVIEGRQTGVHANTYKLFLERSFGQLRRGGQSGMIVPSGLYTDQGCTGLRKLFLTQAQITYLLCFENRRKVFPIDSRFKFVLFGFCKKQTSGAFDAAFMLHDLEVLAAPEVRSIHIQTDLIPRFSPDALSIMEFRSQRDLDIVAQIYGQWPLLSQAVENLWSVNITQEFNMTHDRDLFNEKGDGWQLFEGKMMHQFTHRYSEPRYWINAQLGTDDLARREISRIVEALNEYVRSQQGIQSAPLRGTSISALIASLGRGPLTAADVRIAPETTRLAFRKVASNTNERTLIVAILPAKVFTGDSLYYLVPWQFDAQKAIAQPNYMRDAYKPALPSPVMAYLCGVCNSFTLDYALRFKVSANVNIFHLYQLPIPRLMPGNQYLDAISQRVARLVCIGTEFDELRRELLGSVQAHVSTDDAERQQLQNEIDALVAHLYGLGKDDLQHILYAPFTFPLVKREIKDGVMGAFAQVETLLHG
jgi:hypothetical protein